MSAQGEQPFDRSTIRRGLVGLVAAKVALLIVTFDVTQTMAHPFDLAKAIVSRALVGPMVVALAIALITYGWAILPRSRVHVLVGAYAAVAVLATAFASDPYLALFGDQRYLGLTALADLLVLYLCVAVAFRERTDWLVLGAALFGAGLLSIAYGALQALHADPLGWALVDRIRPFGTIGNPDTFGLLLSLLFGLGGGAVVAGGGRGIRPAGAALCLAAVAVSAAVATRGTAAGMLAGLAIAAALAVRVQVRPNARLRVAFGALAVAAVLGAALSATYLGERVRATVEVGLNTQDRFALYGAALAAIAERPLVGYGTDDFRVAFVRHRPTNSDELFPVGAAADSAHSWVLQTAATVGVPGLIVLVALAGMFFVSSWRLAGTERLPAVPLIAGAAAYFAHGALTVGTLGVDWFPWVAFAAVAARARPPDLSSRPIRRVPAPVVATAFALVAVIGIAAAWNAYQADRETQYARQGSDLGQADAVGHGLAAVARDGGRADHWNELGRAYYAARRWPESAAAFAEAAARAPYQADFWTNLALARLQQALAGDAAARPATLDAARRAVEEDPNTAPPRVALAKIALSLNDAALALAVAVDGVRRDPASFQYDQLIVMSAAKADPAAARPLVESALAARETAGLRVTLAEVALRQGDLESARTNARRALQLEPANADAQRILRAAGG